MKRQEFVRRVCRGVLSAMACVAMTTGVAQAETIDVRQANTAGRRYNGKSVIKCFTDAACKTPAEENDPATLFIRASLQVLPAGDVPPDHGIVVPGPVRIVPVR